MGDNYWEDKFNVYDIDFAKGENFAKGEEHPPIDEPPRSQAAATDEEAAPVTTVEQEPADDSSTREQEEKARKNKEMYDQLFAKVGKRDPGDVAKADVEKVIAQLDECIATASQPAGQSPQDTSSPTGRRQAKMMRIFGKKLASATDVFIAARTMGRSIIDVDQRVYYGHLGMHSFLTTAGMAARTFHSKWADIMNSETAQQRRDATDKILTAAERLALTVAEVIDTFPGEDGTMTLLKIIDQRCDDDEFSSLEHTMQMVADMQE